MRCGIWQEMSGIGQAIPLWELTNPQARQVRGLNLPPYQITGHSPAHSLVPLTARGVLRKVLVATIWEPPMEQLTPFYAAAIGVVARTRGLRRWPWTARRALRTTASGSVARGSRVATPHQREARCGAQSEISPLDQTTYVAKSCHLPKDV